MWRSSPDWELGGNSSSLSWWESVNTRYKQKALWISCSVHPEDILLRMGEYDTENRFPEPYTFQDRNVHIVAMHPEYDSFSFSNDLVLLRLSEPVKFQPNIVPICLPEDDDDHAGETGWVTGWGRLLQGRLITIYLLLVIHCSRWTIPASLERTWPAYSWQCRVRGIIQEGWLLGGYSGHFYLRRVQRWKEGYLWGGWFCLYIIIGL